MRKLSHEEISAKRLTVDESLSADRLPISVLIDNVRSLYNVGSIFRTSDGARIQKLFLTGFTPYPPRHEIEKTALGATTTVPWEYAKDPSFVVAVLKEQGVKICLLEQTDRSMPYHSLTKTDFPLCLVVGNEINGISKHLVAHADVSIDIPMFGMKQSLNVAVAYGIAIFELVKIFRGSEGSPSIRQDG